MKNYTIKISVFFILTGMLLSGCKATKNANNTQKGATIGVIAGAVLGAVIANNVKGGNAAVGAAIGAAVGGAAGGVIGNKMDKQAREIQEALPGVEVQRVGEGIHLTLGENSVNFDFNKSTLTPLAKANLDKLIPVFTEYKDTNINIYGYTDSKGSDEYNKTLSEKRAEAVKQYLISKGLVSSRFISVGEGEIDPIADNETEEGRGKNRRVEFTIVANDKMIQDAEKEAKN